jgi:hypothetical protein
LVAERDTGTHCKDAATAIAGNGIIAYYLSGCANDEDSELAEGRAEVRAISRDCVAANKRAATVRDEDSAASIVPNRVSSVCRLESNPDASAATVSDMDAH